MSDFLKKLSRDPFAPIDGASIVSVDELGNGYDYRGTLIAPKFEAPQQSWGEAALGVLTAPQRLGGAVYDSLTPYQFPHLTSTPMNRAGAGQPITGGSGDGGWQVPPVAQEGWNALTAVGDAYTQGMSEDEMRNRALGMAGFMMGGGGLAARPAGGTGMFAGRLARTADQEALARAERLAAEGADRNAIWNETGWFQGPDQKWRFEIDDSAASFSPPGSTFAEIYDNASGFKSMGDVLSHQNLYGAYPDTADLGLGISKGDVYGSFGGRGVNDLEIKGSSPRGEAMETLLHEGQHAIQATEEFAKGGNPESMSAPLNSRASWEARLPAVIRSELDDLGIDKLFYSDARVPEIKESIRQRIENDIGQPFDFRKIPGMDGLDEFGMALEQTRSFPAETLNQIAMNRLRDTGLRDYERLAGETEARNVQKRMNMSADERRATPPWETQDIPDIDQIVRLYSNASKEGAVPGIAGALEQKGARPEPSANALSSELSGTGFYPLSGGAETGTYLAFDDLPGNAPSPKQQQVRQMAAGHQGRMRSHPGQQAPEGLSSTMGGQELSSSGTPIGSFLDRSHYPRTGLNPIHEVHNWAKVRSMARKAINGEHVPGYLYDGSNGNGNLLAGTHRSSANELLDILGYGKRIKSANINDVLDEPEAYGLSARNADRLRQAAEDGDYRLIDEIWDQSRDTSLFSNSDSRPALLAGALDIEDQIALVRSEAAKKPPLSLFPDELGDELPTKAPWENAARYAYEVRNNAGDDAGWLSLAIDPTGKTGFVDHVALSGVAGSGLRGSKDFLRAIKHQHPDLESIYGYRMRNGLATPDDKMQSFDLSNIYSNADSRPALLASALDMSPEARLARAREMGFDTDRTLYHGTDKEFDAFAPSNDGSLGSGVYLTPSEAYAGKYGQNILQTYVRGNILDETDVPASVSRGLAGPWKRNRTPATAVADWARANGYDGIRQDGFQTVVFDPKNIRSVDAAFDPSMAGSANLLAANADSKPALLASALGQEEGYAGGGRVGFSPRYLVMHDYAGTPANKDGVFNPYHALVFPDGSIRYRNPDDPYGKPAPHAYRLNPESVGLSYAGDVGSQPTAAAMETLRNEAKKIGSMFPGIEAMGHGEAFQATRGTSQQASRDGRDLDEASWRSNVIYGPPAPGQTQVASAPVPLANRGLTTFAGLGPSVRPLPSPVSTASDADDATPESIEEAKPSFDFMKLASLFAEPEPAPAPQVQLMPIQAFQTQGAPIEATTPYRSTFAHGGQVRGLPDGSEPIHAGPLHSTVPGRTDHLPITVAAGSFVLPADIVSSLGEGNTNAGMETVSKMFPLPPVRRADGGRVPIAAAGGEFVIAPETVAALGNGDLDAGHELLDQFVRRARAQNIQRLRALPGPEK